MVKYSKKQYKISELSPGEQFLTKSDTLGVLVGPSDCGGVKIKNTNTSEVYVIPHGDYPVFKEIKYNNSFKKKDYEIRLITKKEAYEFIRKYHYLGDARFFAKFSYGLFVKGTDEIVGSATFSNPQGNVAMKGWFGLPNSDQTVLELSRLCLIPDLNGGNATSYLLGNSIKELKKEGIRAVITLADDSRHIGSIYQVCNFTYYGLTSKKSDFYLYVGDGTFKKNFRGKTSGTDGVWVGRTRKHRYGFILDKTLKCLYNEEPKPTKGETNTYDCCGGTLKLHDKRFGVDYTCPICTGELNKIN